MKTTYFLLLNLILALTLRTAPTGDNDSAVREGRLPLNQFAEVNRQRYEVGNASQADVLTAQTDAAKLLEAQSDIFRRISDAQSQLNVLMNRPAQAPLAQPSQIPFQAPHFSLQTLQAVALSARPEMQRAQN